jgi:hypothetical protein
MLPDPGFYADCMREAFAELVAAADSLQDRATDTVAASVAKKTTQKARAKKQAKSAMKTGAVKKTRQGSGRRRTATKEAG